MPEARVRRSDPHRCPECGARFEASYFDDRTGERSDLPPVTTQARCPGCGRGSSLSLPAGAERTLQLELSEGAEADEGGSG